MCYRWGRKTWDVRKSLGTGPCKVKKKKKNRNFKCLFHLEHPAEIYTDIRRNQYTPFRQTNAAELNSLRFTQFLIVVFNFNNYISFAFTAMRMNSQKAEFSSALASVL